MGKKNFRPNNREFIDTAWVNDATYWDYLDRLKKVAMSIFEWVNLPPSMDARYIEKCLYYHGSAAFLYDETLGYINTNCATSGQINIYGLPTAMNCYSYGYQETRTLWTGLKYDTEGNPINEKQKDCILVMNNWEKLPTCTSLELFALRLYEAERACDVNIKAQKTPVMLLVNEKQRLSMKNLYLQYDGNEPFIFGDKDSLDPNMIKAIKTDAPFVADKLMEYKKEIWNEALMFLGINSLSTEKKERLITDEASANNELINMNLQSYLVPRQNACRLFNEKYGLTGTDKEISVRVRSDLFNLIKQNESIISDYKDNEDGIINDIDITEDGDIDG